MQRDFFTTKKQLPCLGVGLGLRTELAESIFAETRAIDFLEIIPEQYMSKGGESRERLEKACSLYRAVSHGVNLSLGSTDELDWSYLQSLKQFVKDIRAPWFSDHVCFASLGQVYLHELLPVPFSRAALEHMRRRIEQVKAYIDLPFLVENTTFYMKVPGSTMSEAQFLSELLEQADCGLLLDINNVYVNCINHGLDPYSFLDQLPLERTVQIHMAGHKQSGDIILDTHGSSIAEPVYDLLKYALGKPGVAVHGITIERDQNQPEFAELKEELAVIRAIYERNNSAPPPVKEASVQNG